MKDQGASISAALVVYRMLTVVLASAIFVCWGEAASAASSFKRYDTLLQNHQRGDLDVLRVREDAARRRLWVLTDRNVYVYDTAGRTLIRRIEMPNWSIADAAFMCPPDIALDARGAAFVSNNVLPRLLEIDPVAFRTREHQLRLVSRKQWDVGFGGLAFAADGTLYALSAVAGSVFRIDLANRNAVEVAAAARASSACALPFSRDDD